MFEEFQEAAEKKVQRKKIKQAINIATGMLFSVMLILVTFYTN